MKWFNRKQPAKQYSAAPVDKLIANATSDETIRGRLASAISGGYDNADTMHNIFTDFGYPETVAFDHNWNMYRRFGIAKNVRSEEHTSELQSRETISYAVFCLKKKNTKHEKPYTQQQHKNMLNISKTSQTHNKHSTSHRSPTHPD